MGCSCPNLSTQCYQTYFSARERNTAGHETRLAVGVDVEVEVGQTVDVWAVVEGSGVSGFGHTGYRTSSGQHSEMVLWRYHCHSREAQREGLLLVAQLRMGITNHQVGRHRLLVCIRLKPVAEVPWSCSVEL